MDQRHRRPAAAGGATPGIVALARVTRLHWYAVQRDILALGYRKSDIFTTLTVEDMTAIIVAAPPGSAVHHAVNDGFTLTDHLLATMYEHQAGLVRPTSRVQRPGVTDMRPARPASVHNHDRPVQKISFDLMTIDELEARRRAKAEGA